MNQEYLWSKTGNDPEVEGLEGLLGEFRFDENAEAEIPATNVIPVTGVSKRRWFFGLSFAATAAAALVLMAVWFTKSPDTPIASDQHDLSSVQDNVESKNDDTSDFRSDDRANTSVPNTEPLRLAEPVTRQSRARGDRAVHVVKARKKEKLTKEEKYA